jgi:hypothetical protein
MARGFAKNLLARWGVDVVGFDNAASDAEVPQLAALRVANHLRVVDGRDGM